MQGEEVKGTKCRGKRYSGGGAREEVQGEEVRGRRYRGRRCRGEVQGEDVRGGGGESRKEEVQWRR